MATQLGVYNLALLQMKASPLASLTENVEARRVLDTLWLDTRLEMLESGYWRFAMRSVEITNDPLVIPNFGESYVFNKPSDWVKTYLVSVSEYFDPPFENWREEANQYFADVTPLYVQYVSNNGTGYGLDMTKWTQRFAKALAFNLAWRAAPKVVGSSDAFTKKLEEDYRVAMGEALAFEALRMPVRRPPQGQWNTARFGSRTSRSGWSGGYRIG